MELHVAQPRAVGHGHQSRTEACGLGKVDDDDRRAGAGRLDRGGQSRDRGAEHEDVDRTGGLGHGTILGKATDEPAPGAPRRAEGYGGPL